MRVAVAAMVVVILGAPGRCVSSHRGSSGGDCVGKYWCRGLVKIEYRLVSWPFLAVFMQILSPWEVSLRHFF